MDATAAKTIAADLFAANRARARYQSLPANVTSQPLEHAYQVQNEFNQLQMADNVGAQVGYKIALTSAAMQAFAGVNHPLAGVVYSSRVHPSPSRQSLSDYIHVGVEFEVTVRMGAALPPGDSPHTRASVAASIATCAPSYELIEDRNADMSDVNAFSLVAENSWNAGLILGSEVQSWHNLDFANGATRLLIDDELVGEGKISDALGHPFEAVAWLANLLNTHGSQLEKDMVVMTGSSITTRFPVAGQHYKFVVDGLGEVEIDWVA